jgi:hypothetical protein
LTAEETLSAKEVARELGTDARTLRKFFRSGNSPIDPVGQGGRYAVTQKQIKKVKKAFDDWGSKSKPPAEKTETPIVEVEELEEVEELDLEDLDPTDEDILDLEDEEFLDD